MTVSARGSRTLIASGLLLALTLAIAGAWVGVSSAPLASYAALPLSFEANAGQIDPQVRFTARGSGSSLFLTQTGAVLALSR